MVALASVIALAQVRSQVSDCSLVYCLSAGASDIRHILSSRCRSRQTYDTLSRHDVLSRITLAGHVFAHALISNSACDGGSLVVNLGGAPIITWSDGRTIVALCLGVANIQRFAMVCCFGLDFTPLRRVSRCTRGDHFVSVCVSSCMTPVCHCSCQLVHGPNLFSGYKFVGANSICRHRHCQFLPRRSRFVWRGQLSSSDS